jgi:hypothetical protein
MKTLEIDGVKVGKSEGKRILLIPKTMDGKAFRAWHDANKKELKKAELELAIFAESKKQKKK